ncbi:MAG: hypothetical protein V8S95_07905 [Odoribacter sp.]
MESGDYMTACIMMLYKFYELYYYNNLQEDVNKVVVKALKKTSAQPWEQAAPVLYEAMEAIMEDELDDDEEENNGIDMNEYMKNMQAIQQQVMQNMQQMMQGNGMQSYLQQVQLLQQQLASGQISAEEYTTQVQELAAKNFGN